MAESSVQDLTAALGKRLALTEEEDVGLALDEDGSSAQNERISSYCLIGTVLIRKRYNMEAMANTLAGVWRPVKAMHMRILGNNLFAFYFFHPVDMQRVMAIDPWHFANHAIVLKEAHDGGQAAHEDLFKVPFWIQVHGLPPDRLTEGTGRRIGGVLGCLTEVNVGRGNAWGVEYIRVRVFIDARKPLRRGMSLSLKGGPIWVHFRYERLQNFCYCCGRLDHVERDCELGLEMEQMEVQEQPYGNELRAGQKSQPLAATSGGGRWLRDPSEDSIPKAWQRGVPYVMESSQYIGKGNPHTNTEQRNWQSHRPLIENVALEGNLKEVPSNLANVSAGSKFLLNFGDLRLEGDNHHHLSLGGIDSPYVDGVGINAEISTKQDYWDVNHDTVPINDRVEVGSKAMGYVQALNDQELDTATQAHISQASTPHGHNVELGQVFVFSSEPHVEGPSPWTHSWKKEARHGRPASQATQRLSGRMKRKEEWTKPMVRKLPPTKKRCKGAEEDGTTAATMANAAVQP